MKKANATKIKSLIWICLLLLITMTGMSVTAQAETETIPYGDYTIDDNGVYQLPKVYSGTITIGSMVTEVTVTDAVYKAYHPWASITIADGRSAALELTIEDIDITAPIGAGIDLSNLVSDENMLYISGASSVTGGDEMPGIYVPDGVGLIIDEAPGSEGAQLTATGGSYAAGIGGGIGGVGGNITISEGTVTATGSSGGAGIGGGIGGAGGNITISEGTVTATGSSGGAGIGGGIGGAGGNITIGGGTVTATGSNSAAGIGGGAYEAGGNITISGGTVTATGSSGGAGIGGGSGGAGGNITIDGGTVTATGGDFGAGIGGGYFGAGGDVIIMGSPIVYATGDIEAWAEQVGAGCNGLSSGTLKDATDADLSYVRFITEGIA